MTHSFETVKSIEQLEDFQDEYVYDVEVDHETHTFIANDILVHNSVYVQFDSAIDSIKGLELTDDAAMKLCVEIDHHRIAGFFTRCFDKYAQKFNTKNRLTLKLENMSDRGIWLKKKNYAIRVAYKPNNERELIARDKRKLTIKGLEPVKSSYPIWARKKITEIIELFLDLGNNINIEDHLSPRLLELREEFSRLSIDEIAYNYNIRAYTKYVDDIETLSLKKGMTVYPRAAAHYNHLLIKTGLSAKYPQIREKEKIKFYHCAENEHSFDVFAYSPGNFPEEIAPPVDMKMQFFTLIVKPINRMLAAMKMSELDENLRRQVVFIKPRTRKSIDEISLFPLYAVNTETLEHSLIEEHLWPYLIPNKIDVSEDHLPDYLEVLMRYGLNTTVVPEFELTKYIKRLEKKIKEAEPEEDDDDDDGGDE